MEISEKEIEAIVRSVLSGLAQKDFQAGALHINDRTCSNGQDGIFEQVEDAIEAARTAQKEWIHRYKLEDRKESLRLFGRHPVLMPNLWRGWSMRKQEWDGMRIRL